MPQSRRKHFLTDEAVQGELLFRAIVYWFFCLMTVSLMVIAWNVMSGPPRPLAAVVRESLTQYTPAILGSVILLPIVLIDVLKVSNRFVGPIHQVRTTMRHLAGNEPTVPVMLRADDFWQDLALYSNQVAVRLNWGEGEGDDESFDPEQEEAVDVSDTSEDLCDDSCCDDEVDSHDEAAESVEA